jgi:DNA-binding beta-propeller fold protein YncE
MHRQLSLLAALSMVTAAVAAPALPVQVDAFAVIKRIPGPDGNWDYAIADAVGRRLYVARDYGVMALDLDTDVVTPQVIAGHGVHGIAAVSGTALFVSTNSDSNTATVFDGRLGKALGSVATGVGPDSVVFEPKSQLAMTFNQGSHDVTLFKPATLQVVGTIPLGGTPEFGAVDGQGHAYVNISDKNEISVIDVSARRVTGAIALEGCEEPSGLAYDPVDQVLISVCFNGLAEFIDVRTRHQIARITTGKFPDAVIWDADRRLAFVPSFADGTLSVVSVPGKDGIKLLQTLPTQKGTRTGALDAKTGKVYLSTSKLNPPAREGAYPTPVPGTFEIWVVDSAKGAVH